MNLGRELISYAIRTGDLKPFLDAGLTATWMDSRTDLTRLSVFPGGSDEDRAYRYLLSHWAAHHKTPPQELFAQNFPALRLAPGGRLAASEILEEAYVLIHQQVYAELTDSLQDILAGTLPQHEGLTVLAKAIRKLRESAAGIQATDWDDPDTDVEALIHREITEGIRTGIPELDRQFTGWQAGNFVVFVGRPKAGKTWTLLQSALDSWHRGRRVLFVTVEMTSEEISDRLNAMGARIPLTDLQLGKLSPPQEKRLREFRNEMDGYEPSFTVIQPQGSCTASDIEAAIERYHPDCIYVDGFYFLVDELSGKSGGNWEGQDALAKALKTLAMDHGVAVITTTQVREKQLASRKADIDDTATMGGTALSMYADMLWTINVSDEGIITVCQSRTRTVSVATVRGRWDWQTTMFTVLEDDDEGPDDDPGF